jgi:hypothetical protein
MSRFWRTASACAEKVERDDDREHAEDRDDGRRKRGMSEGIAARSDAERDERDARQRKRADTSEEARDRPPQSRDLHPRSIAAQRSRHDRISTRFEHRKVRPA